MKNKKVKIYKILMKMKNKFKYFKTIKMKIFNQKINKLKIKHQIKKLKYVTKI